MFLIYVFMVHFMRPAQSFEITVIRVSQYFKTLVNKNVVHKKVCRTIGGDTYSNIQGQLNTIKAAQGQANDAWDGKNQEKEVVSFKKSWVVFLVVIPV